MVDIYVLETLYPYWRILGEMSYGVSIWVKDFIGNSIIDIEDVTQEAKETNTSRRVFLWLLEKPNGVKVEAIGKTSQEGEEADVILVLS